MRFAGIIAIAYLSGALGGVLFWSLFAGFLILVFLARGMLRWKGRLGVSKRAEARSQQSVGDGNGRFICFGVSQELDELRDIKDELFAPLIFTFCPIARKWVEWGMVVAGMSALVLCTAYVGFGHILTVISVFVAVCFIVMSSNVCTFGKFLETDLP